MYKKKKTTTQKTRQHSLGRVWSQEGGNSLRAAIEASNQISIQLNIL